jgi:hypothetical protein
MVMVEFACSICGEKFLVDVDQKTGRIPFPAESMKTRRSGKEKKWVILCKGCDDGKDETSKP